MRGLINVLMFVFGVTDFVEIIESKLYLETAESIPFRILISQTNIVGLYKCLFSCMNGQRPPKDVSRTTLYFVVIWHYVTLNQS